MSSVYMRVSMQRRFHAMHKNWNQRVDIKRDNRLYGIRFINAEKYNSTIGVWEILSGIIHMNVGEYGMRPRDKHVCRFEARMYHPYKELALDLEPMMVETRASRVLHTHP